MAGDIKFRQGFEVGDARKLHAWLISMGAKPGQPYIIAPNTTVRMDRDDDGRYNYTYRFYNTDVVTIHLDGSVSIGSAIMSHTTKRRMNQFLAPLDCYVYTKLRVSYFQKRGGASVELKGGVQRIAL